MTGRTKKKLFCEERFKAMMLTATFSMAIQYLLMLSDNIVVGHMIGEEGVAGLNLVVPVYSFVVFVCIMISMGTAICFSGEMGQLHEDRAHQFFGQGVILAAAAGILMMVGMLLGKELFFRFFNPSAEVLQYAKPYYEWFVLVALLMPIYSVLVDIVYNDGDMLLCNLSYLFQVGGNILFSILLCRWLGMAGVCLGTVIGNLLSIVVLVLHFLRKQNSIRFVWHISREDLLRVFKFSVTDAGTYLAWSLLLSLLSKFLIVNFGDFYLPVLTVATSLMEMNVVFDGIGQALEPLVGVYHGEKNSAGIRKSMRIAEKLAVAEGVVMTLLLLLFPGAVVGAFGIEDLTLVKEAKVAVRLMAPCCIFYSLAYLYSSYYLYIEKIQYSFLILFLKDLAAPFVTVFPLGLFFGMKGMWIGMAIAPLLADLISAAVIIKRCGKKEFPLLLEEENIYSGDLELTENNIVMMCEEAEDFLRENQVGEKAIQRTRLLLEEFSAAILERNAGKKVLLECTVLLEQEDICLILRDDGEILNIAGGDCDNMDVLRRYVVSYLKDKMDMDRYLLTTGYNRNIFRLPN